MRERLPDMIPGLEILELVEQRVRQKVRRQEQQVQRQEQPDLHGVVNIPIAVDPRIEVIPTRDIRPSFVH